MCDVYSTVAMLRHSQTMEQAATDILFIEFPDLQFYIDLVIDSVYITGTYRFCLYFFFHRDFTVLLSHPLFDPTAPFIAIPLYMALPAPPPAPPMATPPTSPPQVVPSLTLDNEDPSEASKLSSGLSFGPSDDYTLAEPGMANGFLSSAFD